MIHDKHINLFQILVNIIIYIYVMVYQDILEIYDAFMVGLYLLLRLLYIFLMGFVRLCLFRSFLFRYLFGYLFFGYLYIYILYIMMYIIMVVYLN